MRNHVAAANYIGETREISSAGWVKQQLSSFLHLKAKLFTRKQPIKLMTFFLIAGVVFGAACRSERIATNDTLDGLVVVNSTTDGVIRRVLVSEGATVGKDAGLVEIAVLAKIKDGPTIDETKKPVDAEFSNVEGQIKNAEEEVKRTSVEVERVQPLVASNSVPQSQLDAAQADFQRAQRRLQDLKEKENSLRTKNIIARSDNDGGLSPDTSANQKFVIVRVPAAGVLKVINARVGQKVKAGQPLATISQN